MYKCATCGVEWESNYCPQCGKTLDRELLERPVVPAWLHSYQQRKARPKKPNVFRYPYAEEVLSLRQCWIRALISFATFVIAVHIFILLYQSGMDHATSGLIRFLYFIPGMLTIRYSACAFAYLIFGRPITAIRKAKVFLCWLIALILAPSLMVGVLYLSLFVVKNW